MATYSEAGPSGESTSYVRWSTVETRTMLQIWSEESIQSKLTSMKRNNAVFKEISVEMKECGFTKSAMQIRTKLRKLKSTYYKTKQENNVSGSQPHNFDYFDIMDQVLNEKYVAAVTIESMDNADDVNVIQSEDGSMSPSINSEQNPSNTESSDASNAATGEPFIRAIRQRKRTKQMDYSHVFESLVELQKQQMELQAKRDAAHFEYLKEQSVRDAAREQRDQEFKLAIAKLFTDSINNLASAIKSNITGN